MSTYSKNLKNRTPIFRNIRLFKIHFYTIGSENRTYLLTVLNTIYKNICFPCEKETSLSFKEGLRTFKMIIRFFSLSNICLQVRVKKPDNHF